MSTGQVETPPQQQIRSDEIIVNLQTSAKELAIAAIKEVATQLWKSSNKDFDQIKIDETNAAIRNWNDRLENAAKKGGKSRSKNKASRVKSAK